MDLSQIEKTLSTHERRLTSQMEVIQSLRGWLSDASPERDALVESYVAAYRNLLQSYKADKADVVEAERLYMQASNACNEYFEDAADQLDPKEVFYSVVCEALGDYLHAAIEGVR